MFTISADDTSYGYRFENYNSNGTNMDSGAGDAVGTLTVFEDQIMMFQLNQGGHAFAIRTGASGGNTGTNLTSSNGGNNLIHIATDGTVTSGTSANAKTSGYSNLESTSFWIKPSIYILLSVYCTPIQYVWIDQNKNYNILMEWKNLMSYWESPMV